MKKILGAVSLQCLAAVVLTQAPLTAQKAEAVGGGRPAVSCATPDQWTGAARTSTVLPLAGPDDGSFDQPSIAVVEGASVWEASYRGRGLGRSRGGYRARLARQGGIWVADVDHVGISETAALGAFRRLGVWARRDGGGRIVFRAKDGDTTATKALEIVRGSRAMPTRTASPQVLRTVGIDTAMMRLEGRYSDNAVQFVESLASGMDVYPFGTSFVVKVPARLVGSMWDSIDNEGGRVFLVGSSASAVQGRQVSDATQYCGATALLRRFPTPTVTAAMADGAILEVEAQRMAVTAGDVVLTVRTPVTGRGIEVGVSRFSRR